MKRKTYIAILSGLCFTILTTLYGLLIYREYRQERERYGYIAQNEVASIVSTIDSIMARIDTLTALVQDNHGDTEFFDDVADDLYYSVEKETGVSLKDIAVAPGGIVSKVYPLEGNENLLGIDLMGTAKAGDGEYTEAVRRGETILTNPSEPVQGRRVMDGRASVIMQEENGQSFWGIVSVTIDFDNLISALKLDNYTRAGISYELSYIGDDWESHTLQSDGSLGDKPVVKDFAVRNLTWQLKLAPSGGWINITRCAFVCTIILASSVFIGILTGIMVNLHDSNERLKHMYDPDKTTGITNGQQEAYDTMADLYKKILYVDLTKDTYTIVKANREELAEDKGFDCSMSEWLQRFVKTGQVHEDDIENYMAETNLVYIRDLFEKGVKTHVVKYRRKNGNTFDDAVMEMIPVNNFSEDNQRMYLFVRKE